MALDAGSSSPGFRDNYLQELEGNPAVGELADAADGHELVTLLYVARDQQYNQAVVRKELLGPA